MDNVENWQIAPDSIINNYTEYTDCKDIFQGVCNELGRYFKEKGFRYAKSGPRISGTVGDIKVRIGLSTTRTNRQGESVGLAISPLFSSIKMEKSFGEESAYIWGYPEVYYRFTKCAPRCDVIVRRLFAPDIERSDAYYKNQLIISNNINVWGIDETKLVRLIDFINVNVIDVMSTLQDEARLRKYLLELDNFTKSRIKNDESSICHYLSTQFPELYKDFKSLDFDDASL
ncbi:MAG: hypothetical protein HWE27_04545 [Gammaproteobacteria bacterium]|nr:hypothetical protein [Gammaproteobacteria bacterium]